MTTVSNAFSHDDYQPMLSAVRHRFAATLTALDRGNKIGPLFTTDVDPERLWKTWLFNLPWSEQQHHNCRCCQRFIERYAGLVRIDEDGRTHSAIIGDAPGIYNAAFDSVRRAVESARVTGVHVSSESLWGTPSNSDKRRGCTWSHLCVIPTAAMRWWSAVKTAHERAAELAEDRGMLARALAEFRPETVKTALQIAKSDALYRGEKVEGRLQWLADLHDKTSPESTKRVERSLRDSLLWLAAATAPAGFCHVKSSVVGSLLEDIEAGKSLEAVRRAFDDKMHPLRYQRPTAPPSAGNVKAAEELVAKLGIAPSLRRRFARLEEVRTLWTPSPKKLPATGVFGFLLEQPKPGGQITGPTLTWEKFQRTVLPTAEEIQVSAPSHGYYTAFVTAADPDAPPILKWDREDDRYPVSWYTYSSGSTASQWNLGFGSLYGSYSAGKWVPCTGIAPIPDPHEKGVLFVLEGCRDTASPGPCLFPELLRSELHGIRSTIEAYSRQAKMEGAAEASACGLTVRGRNGLRVRVTAANVVTEYNIDRWD